MTRVDPGTARATGALKPMRVLNNMSFGDAK